MYRKTFLAAIAALLLLSAGYPVNTQFSKYHFGVGLGTGAHSALYTLFIVKEYKGKVLSVKGISADQFIMQASGRILSRANPDTVDFFEYYNVRSCQKKIDENGNESRPCSPFEDLWRLRFSEYPIHHSTPTDRGLGWAKYPTKPSDAQMKILATYGIRTYTGMCFGENAFRLLRDIKDPMWVNAYRAAE